MLELLAHPFSSYCWKALIALYENEVPFRFLQLDSEHPDNLQLLRQHAPHGKFPVLLDRGEAVFEATIIIEYLEQRHPGPVTLIPRDEAAALRVRMLDRFFDNYVMSPMQRIVADHMREPALRQPTAVADAETMLRQSYAWLDRQLRDRTFACGSDFSLADCAAAPALFYADWVCEIASDQPALRAYRSRLLERPSVRRCVDEARPYRHFFPPGAPDRD